MIFDDVAKESSLVPGKISTDDRHMTTMVAEVTWPQDSTLMEQLKAGFWCQVRCAGWFLVPGSMCMKLQLIKDAWSHFVWHG